jgi:hypothetical protein
MATAPRERAFAALEMEKRGGDARTILSALRALAKTRFDDAPALLRFHEALLFLRAHPVSPAVLRGCETLLRGFSKRTKSLAEAGADLSPLTEFESAGIAGVPLTMSYGWDATRWLARRRPKETAIDWEGYEGFDRLGGALPRFIPLLEEEALVDANVPYRAWIDAARPRGESELGWLLDRFDSLRVTPRERAELWEALGLFVTWTLRDEDSRTRLRAPAATPFFHDGPFLSRRDVDLPRELGRPRLDVRRLPSREGARLLEIARTTLAARYREIWCFNHGDPGAALSALPGRGVELVLFGLVRGRRLPLRSGFGLLVLKNGVPIGYGDVFALFEHADVTFNVFPTFREGESAWVYAQVLRLYRAALGTRVFAVDPYQIGLGNHEAIESGAFWFYRKLGFRCVEPALEALAALEERHLAASPGRRTPVRVLRRLAMGALVLEHDVEPGAWDRFHVRNVGLAMNRRARGRFAQADRVLLLAIARAKRARTELRTLRALRLQPKLRAAILSLGSSSSTSGARS